MHLEGAACAVQARRLAGDRLVRADRARIAEVHPSEGLVVPLLARQALAELGGVQPLLAAAAELVGHRQQRRRANHVHRLPLARLRPVQVERELVVAEPRVELHERVVSARRHVHHYRLPGQGLVAIGRDLGPSDDADAEGTVVARHVARAGARQLVVDGQSVGVARREAHLGKAAMVEHERLVRLDATATRIDSAPYAGLGGNGRTDLYAHRHRQEPPLLDFRAAFCPDVLHLEIVHRRVRLRRRCFRQTARTELQLQLGFGRGAVVVEERHPLRGRQRRRRRARLRRRLQRLQAAPQRGRRWRTVRWRAWRERRGRRRQGRLVVAVFEKVVMRLGHVVQPPRDLGAVTALAYARPEHAELGVVGDVEQVDGLVDEDALTCNLGGGRCRIQRRGR